MTFQTLARISAAIALLLGAQSSLAATTPSGIYDEAVLGDLSGDPDAPTDLSGYAGVSGTLTIGSDEGDALLFTGMGSGATQFDFTVTWESFVDGFQIHEGTDYHAPFVPHAGLFDGSGTFTTSASFTGDLYIYAYTYGGDLTYSVSLASTTPVPVPAAAPLLIAGVGGLMALRRKRR